MDLVLDNGELIGLAYDLSSVFIDGRLCSIHNKFIINKHVKIIEISIGFLV